MLIYYFILLFVFAKYGNRGGQNAIESLYMRHLYAYMPLGKEIIKYSFQ